MSGLGTSPIGLSTPFGVGVATEVDAPPTSAPQAARYIDPTTRDYALAEDGSYLRMPELRQRVILAVTEAKGSSSVRHEDGVDIPTRIDASFERRAKNSIASALSFLVDEQALRIDGITIEYPRAGGVTTTIAYTDLNTGTRDTATV